MTVFIYHPLTKLLKKLAFSSTSTKPSAQCSHLLAINRHLHVLLTNETLWDGIIKLSDTHLNLKNNDLDYE